MFDRKIWCSTIIHSCYSLKSKNQSHELYSNNRAQTKRYCSKISDKALESLANECKNITEIKIRNCDRITDAGLLAVVGACEKLTRVDCFGCTLITDSAIRKAASIRTKLIFDR